MDLKKSRRHFIPRMLLLTTFYWWSVLTVVLLLESHPASAGGRVTMSRSPSPSSPSWNVERATPRRGGTVTLTCTATDVAAGDILRISRRHEDQTLTISDNGNLREPFSKMARYRVEHQFLNSAAGGSGQAGASGIAGQGGGPRGTAQVVVTISDVIGEDSSLLVCHRPRDPNNVSLVNITVEVPVSDAYLVTITPDGDDVPSYDGSVVLNEHENLGVGCVTAVEGRHAQPIMTMTIDGQVSTDLFMYSYETTTVTVESGLSMYYTQARLVMVTAAPNPDYNSKKLECFARLPSFDAPLSASAIFTIYYSPIVKCTDYRLVGRIGDTLELNCTVQANPGSRVTLSGSRHVDAADEGVIDIRESAVVADYSYLQLTITPTRPAHFHQYTLRADNVFGSNRVVLELEQNTLPRDDNHPSSPLDHNKQQQWDTRHSQATTNRPQGPSNNNAQTTRSDDVRRPYVTDPPTVQPIFAEIDFSDWHGGHDPAEREESWDDYEWRTTEETVDFHELSSEGSGDNLVTPGKSGVGRGRASTSSTDILTVTPRIGEEKHHMGPNYTQARETQRSRTHADRNIRTTPVHGSTVRNVQSVTPKRQSSQIDSSTSTQRQRGSGGQEGKDKKDTGTRMEEDRLRGRGAGHQDELVDARSHRDGSRGPNHRKNKDEGQGTRNTNQSDARDDRPDQSGTRNVERRQPADSERLEHSMQDSEVGDEYDVERKTNEVIQMSSRKEETAAESQKSADKSASDDAANICSSQWLVKLLFISLTALVLSAQR